MKRILIFAFTTLLLIGLTACGKDSSSSEGLISESLLIGSWVAVEAPTVDQQGMKITFNNLKTTYNKNHTSSSTGQLVVSSPMLPVSMKMSLNIKATWSIKGDKLSETVTDADIKTTTRIPGVPDLGGMMAKELKSKGVGTSTILTLDKKNLVVKEDESGMIITMRKR